MPEQERRPDAQNGAGAMVLSPDCAHVGCRKWFRLDVEKDDHISNCDPDTASKGFSLRITRWSASLRDKLLHSGFRFPTVARELQWQVPTRLRNLYSDGGNVDLDSQAPPGFSPAELTQILKAYAKILAGRRCRPLHARVECEISHLMVLCREQTRDRGLLHNLSLASRHFCSEFNHWLYQTIDRNFDKIPPDNRHLAVTKCLVVSGWKHHGAHDRWYRQHVEEEDHEEINAKVRELLPWMPSLETFIWPECDGCIIESSTVQLLPQVCPKLRDLRLAWPDRGTEYPNGVVEVGEFFTEEGRCTYQPAESFWSKFQNLQVLHLHNLFGELRYCQKQIIQLLLASPGVKELELSLSDDTIDHHRLGHRSRVGDWLFFFRRLCKSLWSNLVDLECIQEVSIDTRHPSYWDNKAFGMTGDYWKDNLEIDLWTFSPLSFPNIRSFTFTCYNHAVHDFLSKLSNHKELAGKLSVFYDDTEPDQFDTAKLEYLATSNGHCLLGLVLEWEVGANKKGCHLEDLLAALRRLTRLTQLWIVGYDIPSYKKLGPVVLEQIAAAAPELQYLAWGWYLWKIIKRDREGVVMVQVRSRKLDWGPNETEFFLPTSIMRKQRYTRLYPDKIVLGEVWREQSDEGSKQDSDVEMMD
ncbi:hypothetical protein QBC35DRAFT_536276 [Podospora australis]|uniref:Uncharacterized protein n=1 Tax=Podospora australis TaxID=1536484 RepID=A0AAN7ADM9_9PEZI|nr:hypothetical protein QBC35DRAFT_536276 [Podospora australis]